MPMISKDDLFRAILAMDVYHRVYNQGVKGLLDSGQIGTATLGRSSDDELTIAGVEHQPIGFFAQEYIWNGESVVVYRGTDNFGPFESDAAGASDIWTGWSLALGFIDDTQAAHAIAFYDDVVGQSVYDRAPASVVLTGHSLGRARLRNSHPPSRFAAKNAFSSAAASGSAMPG